MARPHAVPSDRRIAREAVRRIRLIVARRIELPEDALSPGARLVEDLGADRRDVLQIAADLEREFAMRIEPHEAVALRTVEEMTALVQARSNGDRSRGGADG